MSNDKKETKQSAPQEPEDKYEPVTLVLIENMQKVKTQKTLERV